ncbi:unnamed protein product, partial [Rotaria magnacalcarata]
DAVFVVILKLKCLISISIMRSAIRSDSYAESVKQEIHESTRTSKPSNRRLKTNDDVQQRSLYYPSGNSLPPSARSSVRGSTCM